MSKPLVAIGNDELAKMPELGRYVTCWRCGKRHLVRYGDTVLPDGRRVPSKTVAFFRCGGLSYLCGIDGREWRPAGMEEEVDGK